MAKFCNHKYLDENGKLGFILKLEHENNQAVFAIWTKQQVDHTLLNIGSFELGEYESRKIPKEHHVPPTIIYGKDNKTCYIHFDNTRITITLSDVGIDMEVSTTKTPPLNNRSIYIEPIPPEQKTTIH